MTLRAQIVEAQKNAMKSKETQKLSVLRLLFAAIRNAEIDKGQELSDDAIITLVRQQVKQLTEASKDFESGGRLDLVETYKQEAEILKLFLPEEISDEQIEKVVRDVLSQTDLTTVNVGHVMGNVMKELKGTADGNRVRACVQRLINS